MNTPGVAEGNWTWRLREGALTPELAERLAELVRKTGRAPAVKIVDPTEDEVSF
jgi:4-alpha-glucanotransferase